MIPRSLLCLAALAGAVLLLRPSSGAAYIDGGGARITLPEILLEFHTATLLELDRADAARGAFRWKVAKHLKGSLPPNEVKLQISSQGGLPAALKDPKPGHAAVFFTQCFDKRSLSCIDGIWAWTNPGPDGWETGVVRPDFGHVFIGKSTELSEAVTRLLLGHDVVVRCQGRQGASETEWVRYSMKTPHNKAIARDPGAPAAQSRPVAAWIGELEDPKPRVRVQGALALAEVGPAAREAGPALARALKDKDPEVRYAAVRALGTILPDGKAVVDGLAHALGDDDWFVRYTAAQTLRNFGPRAKDAEAALAAALHPTDPVKDFRPLRCGEAMVALAAIDPHSKALEGAVAMVVEKLLNYQADDSDGARVAGAEMLGACGPVASSAVPALLVRLKDRQAEVRVAAAEALLRISPDAESAAALGVLQAELRSPEVLVRILAAEALGRMGPRAKEAEGALEAALKDPEAEVRQAAGQALKQVAPK